MDDEEKKMFESNDFFLVRMDVFMLMMKRNRSIRFD